MTRNLTTADSRQSIPRWAVVFKGCRVQGLGLTESVKGFGLYQEPAEQAQW